MATVDVIPAKAGIQKGAGFRVKPGMTNYLRTQDVWTITIPLEPGRYEYKFLVDGRVWWNDPFAAKVPNVWGSENFYLNVE